MAIEFIAPDFVEGNDVESIHARMMEMLPEDIDNMPGGFPYDLTRPTALMKSELVQFHLVRTLMLMFPMWAWGSWLDYHAAEAAISRREAGYARGEITILGVEGTHVAAGSVFATPAMDTPSIAYKTLEACVIGSDGIGKVGVIALEPGILSNVAAYTITIMSKPIRGITRIYNEEPITGGTEIEDDDSLRQRIQEVNESKSASFVGNDADYIRWAKEVVGVGSVTVIPEWDGPGTVKLILVDSNGQPANSYIIEDVYNYIISPEDRLERIAPIGAQLTVTAPDVIEISYECEVILLPGYEKEEVAEAFEANLVQYYEEAKVEGVIRFTKVGAVLTGTEGIQDYRHLKINGVDHQNVLLEQDEYPKTVSVVFNDMGERL